MAYNLQPLITILEQTLDPKQTRWNFDDNKAQLQSLLEKSVSLQQIFEETSLSNIECLESQIHDAEHKAEDMIESHMVDQMLSWPGDKSFTFITPDLQQVMLQLESIKEQVVKFMEGKTMETAGPSSSGNTSSNDLSSKSVVVGVDEDLMKLKDRVMGMQSKLEIVPIVGMGGIGKTTLARKLYEDPAIVEHFTSLAWTTVSQDYNMQAILLSLLRCIIGKECDQHTRKESHELKDILYRSLYGRRYLIVFDDIWSIKLWDEMRMYFPDKNNGSRIVITTRELYMAKHAKSHSKQHEMQLLDESASWNLLREEVFGDEEDCPAALERIGRNIVKKCGGLPLAIRVIGGLLSSEANRTRGFWKNVANDATAAAVVAESHKQFSNILSLSYNHLPTHLKPCFLYMGALPQIKATRLIRLLVAEGFLKSKGDKSLEEEAEDCLKALVDRNLVSVRAVKSDGRAKRYGMHDLMRDLCLKKAEEQRFVHIAEKQGVGIRRVSIHSSYDKFNLSHASKFMSLARSFLWAFPSSRPRFSRRSLLALRLLRVLDLLGVKFDRFPKQILQIVNLRYLAIFYAVWGRLTSQISRLCNLQTLVVRSPCPGFYISVPCEILHMAELRHVVVYGQKLILDSDDGSDLGGLILDKLQTLLYVGSSHEFLHRIPNVRNLGIRDESSIFDLYHLHKLESLRFYRGFRSPLMSPSTLRLPLSLRKLSLRIYQVVGDIMNYLCELPNLEILKLQKCEFEGREQREWDATELEFRTLKFPRLESVRLVKWRADETNFPRLRRLVIRDCPVLEAIPSGIGEIPTLQTIELDKHSGPSLVASAKLIIKEQRDNGNNELQLRMT